MRLHEPLIIGHAVVGALDVLTHNVLPSACCQPPVRRRRRLPPGWWRNDSDSRLYTPLGEYRIERSQRPARVLGRCDDQHSVPASFGGSFAQEPRLYDRYRYRWRYDLNGFGCKRAADAL